MKKITLAILCLALSGCSYNNYLTNLRSYNNDYVNAIDDNKLLTMGYELCYYLDSGVKLSQLVRNSENPILTGYIAMEAIPNMCPEYKEQFDNLAEG